MESQEGINTMLVLTSTAAVAFVIVLLIVMFMIFQGRKDKLIKERTEQEEKYKKELAETQIEIREETLRNISWELHDNIGQLLTLAKIQIQQSDCADDLTEVTKTVSSSLQELRSLSRLINPEFINNVRLQEALRLELERFNRLKYIEAVLTVNGDQCEINQKHGIILFRIIQEFFSNTLKHAKASKLDVELTYTEDCLMILASDNGVGFDIEKTMSGGIGLKNIETRAKLIGATASLESVPNNTDDLGTTLRINYYL